MAPEETSGDGAVPKTETQSAQLYTETAAIRKLLASRTVEKFCTFFTDHIRPQMRILDVGCGPGTITCGLARLVPQGEVIGLDASEASLAQATSLAESQGLSNVKFVKGDAHDMSEYGDESFDIVHDHQVLIHLADPTRALREMRRLTKAQGGLIASRNCFAFQIFPETDILKRNMEGIWQHWRSKGSRPDAGIHMQFWAHDSGFSWDKIVWTPGSWAFVTKEERDVWLSLTRSWQTNDAPTDVDRKAVREAWEEWHKCDGSGMVYFDGQMVAWR